MRQTTESAALPAAHYAVFEARRFGVEFTVGTHAGLIEAKFYGEQHRKRAHDLAGELNTTPKVRP